MPAAQTVQGVDAPASEIEPSAHGAQVGAPTAGVGVGVGLRRALRRDASSATLKTARSSIVPEKNSFVAVNPIWNPLLLTLCCDAAFCPTSTPSKYRLRTVPLNVEATWCHTLSAVLIAEDWTSLLYQ